MDTKSYFKIGWIVKPHGLKGEVTAILEADIPADITALQSVFVEQNNRLVPYFIQTVSAQEKKAFLKFEDVDSPEAAASISKKSLYIPKVLRPRSARGEFYDDEVIDFEVHDNEKGLLGKITDVIQAGPNRLLVTHYQDKEVLIPINAPFITSVSKSAKRINVELPDGFLDI